MGIQCAAMADAPRYAHEQNAQKSKAKNKKYGFASLALIGVAFLFLAQALLTLDLSIAYATWGALGILATTFVDKLFFGLKIKPLGAFGIITMIGGIVMLKML